MNKKEILAAIQDLAKSQGFYQRLLNNINDETLDILEKQNFKDVVDMVIWIEG